MIEIVSLWVVTEVDGNVVELAPYGVADCSAITDAKTDLVVLVYGSEFAKGKSYTFTFPADGLTYSIKDPSASGYTGAGSGGRIVD